MPAQQLILKCTQRILDGYMAPHSIPNMFYILRRDFSATERRDMILRLCQVIHIVPLTEKSTIAALKNLDFTDFEDALQLECALAIDANYIITRNPKDFAASPIPCLSAEEFLAKYNI